MNNQRNENYQEWLKIQMKEGDEWENEMVEIEEKITTQLLCSNSKKHDIFESSDTIHLDFSRTSSPNFEHEEKPLIIQELREAYDYIDRFGDNIKKIIINAENLGRTEIGILMRIVLQNCINLNSLILLYFQHGFSSEIETSLPYIINTRIQACNFDTETIMLLKNSSEQLIIIN